MVSLLASVPLVHPLLRPVMPSHPKLSQRWQLVQLPLTGIVLQPPGTWDQRWQEGLTTGAGGAILHPYNSSVSGKLVAPMLSLVGSGPK